MRKVLITAGIVLMVSVVTAQKLEVGIDGGFGFGYGAPLVGDNIELDSSGGILKYEQVYASGGGGVKIRGDVVYFFTENAGIMVASGYSLKSSYTTELKDPFGAITLNGTTAVAGKKAFKTITRVASSAAATDFFVGTGDVFGLPIRADSRNYCLTAWNGAFVTTGTFVAAVTTSPATTTTGDVRGTYAVPDAADGTKQLTVWVFVEDDDTQTGLYGVTQA